MLARFLSDEPFPPYSYVPGRWPHPHSDPAGHAYGEPPRPVTPLDPNRFADCRAYLVGIDLFNHGYYWESHEVWEQLWHAAGRDGPTAWLLQGLIKLAASAVKVREGKPEGTAHLAAGARALFERVRQAISSQSHAGLQLADLIDHAETASEVRPSSEDDHAVVRIVFPFCLVPTDS